MWEDIVNRSYGWTKPTETIIPTNGCPSRNKCIAARTLVLGEVFTKIGAQDISFALTSWRKNDNQEFCVGCHKAAKRAFQSGQLYIWNNLPRYFFGDNWEKLEDTKSDIWPSTWRPRWAAAVLYKWCISKAVLLLLLFPDQLTRLREAPDFTFPSFAFALSLVAQRIERHL